MILLTISIVFLIFWRSAKKHERAQIAHQKLLKEEQERREAAAIKRTKVRAVSSLSVPKRSPPLIVATPRKAAPAAVVAPVKRSYQSSPSPAPTPAPSSDSGIGDVLLGAAAGYAIGRLLDSDDDRPASCSAPAPVFESGGGGDFGGGGATSSWDDSSSSSSSSSDSGSSSYSSDE